MNINESGRPFAVLLGAVALVGLMSMMPLSELSNGGIKNYNLFADLMPEDETDGGGGNIYIDPDLLALAENGGDTNAENDAVAEPVDVEEDTIIKVVSTGDGSIEDYTIGTVGFANFKKALSSGRLTRVAVIGDSYIEGDILTQHIRESLQQKFGGEGVGYVPASSNLTGFRQSVSQTCGGWKEHDFRNSGKKYPTLQGFFYSPNEGETASVVLKGSNKFPSASQWSRSRVLFVAEQKADIIASITKEEQKTFSIEPTDEVQQIEIEGNTNIFSVSLNNPGIKVLGLYADGQSGVAVDNMSIRGYSGIRHNLISPTLAEQMRKFIDYDLIIVEYGINALSAEEENYNHYAKAMEKAISNLRGCYPNADFLMMGIGDRGEKVGSTVKSMKTVKTMIDTQRQLAEKLGLLFWDTRAAMGGENAVVEWANNKDINKDYIHLSAKGGERLANLFVNSLNSKLDGQ